jgi:GT2 family glycosyltransferase
VEKAVNGMEAEVFVVDNNSTDGSADHIEHRFHWVTLIRNNSNPGFSKANNQALQQAKGKYILFLNPDTIVGEDCFRECTSFMDRHANAGALGVYMMDGSGEFLKESKRGFPSPFVSATKMMGLSNLFPSSKIFARYYLGHLDQNQTHEVDALSGAFMMARKDVLDITGGFDERFFMYAEDLDLSYRILESGYKNYYFPQSPIIHFKGESTRKDLAYTKQFHKAMMQFVDKHYSGTSALYTSLLKAAIFGKERFDVIKQKFLPRDTSEVRSPGRNHNMIYLHGDATTSGNLKARLINEYGFTLSPNAEKAATTLLCEGKDFSFKDVIGYMKQNAGSRYMIFAENASSIISSHASQTRGNIIVLQDKN